MNGRPVRKAAVAMVALLLAAADAGADPQRALSHAVSAYSSLTPIAEATGLDENQALEVQRMLVLSLRPRWGEVVGYKAALTAPAARRRFGIDDPVLGVLMENMFTTTGSTIDRDAGVRLMLEADLMVRVGDASINSATSEAEILAALDLVIPYVEVPDLMFDSGVELTAADIVAVNAGARIGVMGMPVEIGALEEAATALSEITVEMVDGSGELLTSGRGDMLLGGPLRAARWIRDQLAARGVALKPGDLLSLGSMGAPVALEPGLTRVTATYRGLGVQPQRVHIGFR